MAVSVDIQVTEDILSSGEWTMVAAMQTMMHGREFDTPNGEMPDVVARTIASWYASPENKVLTAFAQGQKVNWHELLEAVGLEGRSGGWSPELEYLATWVLNR